MGYLPQPDADSCPGMVSLMNLLKKQISNGFFSKVNLLKNGFARKFAF